MADLFYSKQKAKTNRVGLAPTHPGSKKAVDPYRYLKYAALAYLIYAVLKYVGVADEMNGSGPANGIFSLFALLYSIQESTITVHQILWMQPGSHTTHHR